jgi:hypothetical protein
MMTSADMLKAFLDDMIRQRWGDLVALFLILLGVWLIIHSADDVVRGEAKGLIGAGLFALRPKTMAANGNGNGSSTTSQTTTTTQSSAKTSAVGNLSAAALAKADETPATS